MDSVFRDATRALAAYRQLPPDAATCTDPVLFDALVNQIQSWMVPKINKRLEPYGIAIWSAIEPTFVALGDSATGGHRTATARYVPAPVMDLDPSNVLKAAVKKGSTVRDKLTEVLAHELVHMADTPKQQIGHASLAINEYVQHLNESHRDELVADPDLLAAVQSGLESYKAVMEGVPEKVMAEVMGEAAQEGRLDRPWRYNRDPKHWHHVEGKNFAAVVELESWGPAALVSLMTPAVNLQAPLGENLANLPRRSELSKPGLWSVRVHARPLSR